MSRRDTIIIAVLINAGLLVVLFSTALKTDHASEEVAVAPVLAAPTPQVAEIQIQREPVAGDEVDQVLSQFAAERASTPSDFMKELQAIAEPQSAPPVQQEPASIEIVVKKGDVLDKLARQNNTSVEEIMRTNHLTSTHLKIGQVLKVSPNTKKALPTQKAESPAKFYTVKNGDNPWTIAVKNHMKVDELLKLNQLDEEKARRLKPGDQLRIK